MNALILQPLSHFFSAIKDNQRRITYCWDNKLTLAHFKALLQNCCYIWASRKGLKRSKI